MKYNIGLFDMDETLFNFVEDENDCLHKLFHSYGYILSEEAIQGYHAINNKLWLEYQNGNIKAEDVLNRRFSETMLQMGKSVDGTEWGKRYLEFLSNSCTLINGALEVCQRLHASHCRLFIITNGMHETQVKRFKKSELYKYFEGIYDSESAGSPKPSKKFFDYVIANTENFNKRTALVVGDRLGSDIKGGNDAGIDTCWFNPESQECSGEIQSTYTIKTLEELYPILIAA